MGQKVNPIGLRLGINKTWDSRWFAKDDYAKKLIEDIKIRQYLKKRLKSSSVSKIVIERTAKKASISIHTARPGVVIGKKGDHLKKIGKLARHEIEKYFGKKAYLQLWVKVKSGWTDDTKALQQFGYHLD